MKPILEYIGVALASTIKFMGGPIAGLNLGLTWQETAISSAIGMMFTVVIITYGQSLLNLIPKSFSNPKKKKIFNRQTRFAVKVKNKLGLWGVAILTPFLFTPVLGTFIAIAFKYPKSEIISKMLVCSLIAGVIQSLVFYYVISMF